MNVTFVSIDVVSVDEDKNSPQNLLDTLDHELGKEESDWKIVFAHYPCYSAGGYPGFDSVRNKVLPIMEKHNVDIYVTGHDHNLQHWTTKSNQGIGMLSTFNTSCLSSSYGHLFKNSVLFWHRSSGYWSWWSRPLQRKQQIC